jgi:hypothetical protein
MLTLFLIPTLYMMLEERFPRRPDPERSRMDGNGEVERLPLPIEKPVAVP